MITEKTEPPPVQARFPFYRGPDQAGARVVAPVEPVTFHSMPRRGLDDPARYRPHPDLVAAVNTALLLGMPLLVTGEPGCGKTQLGEAVAHALGLRHEKFETKSTSQARDVFYAFDVVGRFHARDTGAAADPRSYIEYMALGRAILLAYPRAEIADLVPRGFDHPGLPSRSVVVIDEVDKASRDFPNDILNEIDRMYFRVPELLPLGIRGTPGADDPSRLISGHLRPIVIFTSNSEKKLPDAFLRRCIFFHVPEPGRDELAEIVAARLDDKEFSAFIAPGRPFVAEAVDFFVFLRDPRRALAKKPGVAELLNWLQALIGNGADATRALAEQEPVVLDTLSALFKTSEDLARARPDPDGRSPGLLRQWAAARDQANAGS